MSSQIFSVGSFIQYLNDTFKAVWDVDAVAIEGEVSGFRISQGQWVNFDLKDQDALISAFMVAPKLRFPLQDGMKVRVHGMPRVYPKFGKFSLTVERIELVGEGALKKALAALRAKLEAEGLFDPSRKREIPRIPKRIALIASRESAAYGDFVRILDERWSGLEVELFHVVVQGEKAPESIKQALAQIHKREQKFGKGYYDAIVLTRGGGSFDELMAFNDESLVRALYASTIPTMVAIGHERDLSLAEEVADIRGSTPTDCARRLVPDKQDVLYELSSLMQNIDRGMQSHIDTYTQFINTLFADVDYWLASVIQKQQELQLRVMHGGVLWYERLEQAVLSHERWLLSMNPTNVLARGYALIRDTRGKVLSDLEQIKQNPRILIQLRDGNVHAKVEGEQASLW